MTYFIIQFGRVILHPGRTWIRSLVAISWEEHHYHSADLYLFTAHPIQTTKLLKFFHFLDHQDNAMREGVWIKGSTWLQYVGISFSIRNFIALFTIKHDSFSLKILQAFPLKWGLIMDKYRFTWTAFSISFSKSDVIKIEK